MALQDLTPQLRTRLSRMERAVGWFVFLAVLLLVFGFVYYAYNSARRKGWFLAKGPYYTFVSSATGLKAGDRVMLMGFDAGAITKVEPMPPDQTNFNVYIEFELKWPNYGYIWTEGSRARITTADLLGKRELEVTKGTDGYATYISHPLRVVPLEQVPALPDFRSLVLGEVVFDPQSAEVIGQPKWPLTNLPALQAAGCSNLVLLDLREERKTITGIWNDRQGRYDPFTNGVSKYWLLADESPAVSVQLQKIVGQVQAALPGILNLTNQLGTLLLSGTTLSSNLDAVVAEARPAVSSLAAATRHLDEPGSLGTWLLPTNLGAQLALSLTNANDALVTANTNLSLLVSNLNRSLDNLADLTSNLNRQVQANTNMLSAISDAVVHADELVQGLKKHWLLRSAFKTPKTNPPPVKPLPSPKARGAR